MGRISWACLLCLFISLPNFSMAASLIQNSTNVPNETLDNVTVRNLLSSPSILVIPEKAELFADSIDGSDENCTQNTKVPILEITVHLAQRQIEKNSTASLGETVPPTEESTEDLQNVMEGTAMTTDVSMEDNVQSRQGRKFKNKDSESNSGGSSSGGFFGFMRNSGSGNRSGGSGGGGDKKDKDKKDKKKNKFFGMF